MTIMYLKLINPNDLKREFKSKVETEINKIEKEEKKMKSSSELRFKSDRIEITWNDAMITYEKVDRISFDDKKLHITYESEITVIPLKNVKKVKFPEHLLKMTYHYHWNRNPKTYEDSTSDENPYTTPFIWYKYISNVDTAGNPSW